MPRLTYPAVLGSTCSVADPDEVQGDNNRVDNKVLEVLDQHYTDVQTGLDLHCLHRLKGYTKKRHEKTITKSRNEEHAKNLDLLFDSLLILRDFFRR